MLNLPKTSTAQEIQKKYRKIFDYVKKTKKPVVVMRKNKPDVVIVDVKKLQEMHNKIINLRSHAENKALKLFKKGRIEFDENKLKPVEDLSELI